MVDLGSLANIQFIRILNREAAEWVQLRASPLVVEVSDDGERWTLLFQTPAGHVFSGYSGGQLLVWGADRYNPVETRFVRIRTPRQECLHLAEVEVYGMFIANANSQGSAGALQNLLGCRWTYWSNSGRSDEISI